MSNKRVRTVVLSRDCLVDDVQRRKGEVIKVADNFDNSLIEKVIKEEFLNGEAQSTES